MNALVDALSPYNIRHLDMPATPERVWQRDPGGARELTLRRIQAVQRSDENVPFRAWQ